MPNPMPSLLLLFSHSLTPEQEKSARESYGIDKIIPLPEGLQKLFSNVPPDLDSLQEYGKPLCKWLEETGQKGDLVLIQGDYGLTFILLQKAHSIGLVPIYVTTERRVRETRDEEGRVKMERIFHHKRFREYDFNSTFFNSTLE